MKTRLKIKTLKDLVEVAMDKERWRRLTKNKDRINKKKNLTMIINMLARI